MNTTWRIARRVMMTAAVAAIAAIAATPAAAQNQPAGQSADGNGTVGNGAAGLRFGVYGFGSWINHQADFRSLPTVGCCGPGFESGSGFGYGEGLMLQLPVSSHLAVQLRAGYSQIGGKLTTTEHIGNVLDGETVVDGYSEHRIAPTLRSYALEPLLSIRPFTFPLSINVGGEVGYVDTRDYEQDETLTTPSSATFVGGSRVRNRSQGAIPESSPLRLAAVGGLSYDIMIAENLFLSPEVSYHHQLNDVLEDSTWKAHTVRVGASLSLRMPSSSTPVSPTPTDAGVLSAEVTASGVQSDGVESAIVQMRVEEFASTQLRPLLNYVFFDEGSASLPVRYNRIDAASRAGFSIDGLYNRDVIETYHDVLNIVGRRMVDDPKARIRLIGTNDGESEKGNATLSRRRAEAVRDYLRATWGIADARMSVETRNLPDVPSNGADADGRAENRRVEIIPDRRAITAPVVTNDTLRVSDPPVVRFRTNVGSDAGIASWRVVATQAGRVLREIDGRGAVPQVVDWSLASSDGVMPSGDTPIEYRLELVDNEGRSFVTPGGSIAVEQLTLRHKRARRIADREIDRYSLILFDFDRAELGEANRSIVDLVRSRIARGSTVTITGHTDRVGDSEHNHDLSRDRALTVARSLGVSQDRARGLGESPEKYDNDLPEGRFYCRVVDVTVETPVR
ncbi:MAG TPA: OmpA family protein [Candidatus Kapabacteria bacterium]|nr:OmpA family protein [Candidatus Kapabacteria bacterium]